MQDEQTDALIVGAGPGGLAAAIELADQGVEPLVLERRPRLSRHPRTTALTAEAMRLMSRWGVSDEVCRHGSPSGPALSGETGVAGSELPLLSPDEQVWTCPQGRLEEILSIRALAGGAEVRYGTQLIGLCETAGAVTATAATTDGVAAGIRARYVVGADGTYPGPDLSLALQDGAAAGAAIAHALARGDEPAELAGYRPQERVPAAGRPEPAQPRTRELLRG